VGGWRPQRHSSDERPVPAFMAKTAANDSEGRWGKPMSGISEANSSGNVRGHPARRVRPSDLARSHVSRDEHPGRGAALVERRVRITGYRPQGRSRRNRGSRQLHRARILHRHGTQHDRDHVLDRGQRDLHRDQRSREMAASSGQPRSDPRVGEHASTGRVGDDPLRFSGDERPPPAASLAQRPIRRRTCMWCSVC
jgi:hypothetical protein